MTGLVTAGAATAELGHVPEQDDRRWRAPLPRTRALGEVVAFLRTIDARPRLAVPGTEAVVVAGLTLDSAAAAPGDLFAGLPGARHHGTDWAGAAARAGAVALLADRPSPELPTVVVDDPRSVLGPLASWLHGHPSQALAVHGVTGTNGKTSTAHLLAAALHGAGRPVALAGTLGARTPRRRRGAGRTTAEAPEVAELLATARDDGASDLALEVSSHGLALGRVSGTRFRTAIFTNLSPDHLDLHRDLESYYAAKASLFVPERAELAVVGVDDRWGRRLARTTRCPVVTFSATGGPADFRAEDVRADAAGTRFRLRGPGITREVTTGLLGAHQADNALAAIAALVTTGVDVDRAIAGIAAAPDIPGRLERIDAGQPFDAFVDFAHNTGGHRRLLPFLRSLARGRLVVVVGITGGRDPAKRADLGTSVGRDADVVVVTDESPHADDPAVLRDALAAAARRVGRAEVLVEADRARALARAVDAAGPDDVLVVVGRGADAVQVGGGRRRPFDDRTALHAALRDRWAGADPVLSASTRAGTPAP